YYSSTHVFVYRSDAPFEIATLDDAVLRDLRVGVQMPAGANAGPAVEALAIRDLIGNAVHFAPDPERAQPLAGIVEAVAAGEVDLAIAWGPVAGYFAAQQAEDLRIVPVEPAIDPPFQPLTFSIAIGARPGEEALVDRLNLALADRWDDVQAILDEAHVLRLPQTRPSRSIASEDQTQALVNLGLVTPKLTESSATLGTYYVDLMGEGARLGALLAEGESPGTGDGRLPKVLLATSPTAEVAARAARRLAKTHDLAALIGGVGPGQVEALSTVAADTGTLFLNVGEVPLDTAARCASDAFHLAVSAERYLHALYDWFSREGGDSWYLVYEDSEQGAALAALASDLLAEPAAAGEPGPTLAGSAGMAPRALSYLDVLRDIAVLDPDVVLLLLAPEDQTDFLAQHQVSGEPAAIATYPHLEGQTRERLANIMLRAQNESLRYRVQLWEPTSGMADELTDGPADGAAGGAPPLNSRFAARWGRPMDPTAWTAYAAV